MGHEPPTPDSQRTAEPTAQGFFGIVKKRQLWVTKTPYGQICGSATRILQFFQAFFVGLSVGQWAN